MISTRLKVSGRPRVLAAFSFRYDAHLVPALLANIDPLVDGWVSFDDRASTDLFSNEPHRRSLLLQAAMDLGARWVLAVDPDERFERPLALHIDTLIEGEGVDAYTFALREMYSPDRYRIDGVWGGKRQARLLSLAKGIVTPTGDLHTPWSAFIPSARLVHTPFNLYHLKMITAERRRGRAVLYRALDPKKRFQSMGYSYLADERGATLEQIPAGREYDPEHVEDGGLWMADMKRERGLRGLLSAWIKK